MGTNYYVKDDPTCDNPEHTQTLHIGKSSMGWVFGFHAIKDKGLTSWKAWREFLAGKTITDEYGRDMTLEKFTPVVENRNTPRDFDKPLSRLDLSVREDPNIWGAFTPIDPEREWRDDEGHDFYAGEFF